MSCGVLERAEKTEKTKCLGLRRVNEEDIYVATRNRAPRMVLYGLLRRWAGKRGRFQCKNENHQKILDDVEIFEYGVRGWIPEYRLFEVQLDNEAWMHFLLHMEPFLSETRLRVVASDVGKFEHVSRLWPCIRELKFKHLRAYTPDMATLLVDYRLARLQKLDLASCLIGEFGCHSLFKSFVRGAGRNLRELDLRNNQIHHESCRELAECFAEGAVPCLEVLNLGNNRISFSGCRSLAECFARGAGKSLHELHLASNEVWREGCRSLAECFARGGVPNLRVLNLGSNSIDRTGVRALVDSFVRGGLPNLRELNLENNSIGEICCRELAISIQGLGSLPFLSRLILRDTKVPDAAKEELLSRMSRVREIYL